MVNYTLYIKKKNHPLSGGDWYCNSYLKVNENKETIILALKV